MDGERENFASNRRGFLRQLCALPLIGGGVTLIGQPTAVAAPVSEYLLDTYSTWLDLERRYLAWERVNGDSHQFKRMIGCTRFDNAAGNWHSRALPAETRASLVLAAVGVDLAGGVDG